MDKNKYKCNYCGVEFESYYTLYSYSPAHCPHCNTKMTYDNIVHEKHSEKIDTYITYKKKNVYGY